MAKYVELAKAATPYAKRMNRLSCRIFSEVFRPTSYQSMKVVKMFSEKPANKRDDIANYYPRHPQISKLMGHLREYGLFRDEHLDFSEEIERLRILRGKRPRTKGCQKKKIDAEKK